MTVRVALGDASDPRVHDAARRLADGGRVTPVLVGRIGDDAGLPGIEVFAVPDGEDELTTLARLVRDGGADAGAAGSLTTSSAVVRTALNVLGDGRLVSGTFAIRHETKWVTYADCSVVPRPNPVQLADIAIGASDLHRRMFGGRGATAMLSFSTAGSARHDAVDQVRQGLQIARRRRPDLVIDGEMQLDVAVDPAVAARKMPGSTVAGEADVLVFPSLDAANIAYKTAERVGNRRALGSFVTNLTRPWVDLSRGCSADDIADTVELLARIAGTPMAQSSSTHDLSIDGRVA